MTDLPAEVPQSTTDKLRAGVKRTRAAARDLAARHPYWVRTVAVAATALALLGGWFTYDVLSGLPGRDQLRTLGGVDGIRIVGAVLTDIRERRKAEGASTITQQLARMSFLSRDKTFRRKVCEAILAQRIEKLYSKDEILEFYMNKAYFGDGLYGAEAAARGYFGKSAAELTLTEGALLAGVLKAPSTKNPVANPEQATERRNVVLKLMLEHELITTADYDAALRATMSVQDSLRREDPSGVHFKEQLRRELLERFGKEKVYQGRLKVYATIDPEMQKAAEDVVVQSLKEIEARGAKPLPRARKGQKAEPQPESGDDRLQAALLALDPATGEVRAIVVGRDTQSVGLNRALQTKRQPGSAFKPFVYAAALESGYAPASIIDQLDIPIDTYQGAWLPEDDGLLLVVPQGSEGWRESIVHPIPYSVSPPYRELTEVMRETGKGRAADAWKEALSETVDSIAGLTAVDGAAILTDEYEMLAFGAKIQRRRGAPPVESVTVTEPIEGGAPLVLSASQLGGTRHLSAAQFVHDQRDSIALVASQDRRFTVFAWSPCEDSVHAHRVETLLL
ncbi:MAG: hypothetical protein EXQ55_05120 [Acidobacteria bacterium]|nr:hypothetical protein [Acidobacteriota bacterium]